jgi:phosphohistidine phosphatase
VLRHTLLVLRHAKSDWDTNARTDFERPLSKRGRRDAPKVGLWLRQNGPVPGLVLSSPAERARHTALAVCHELGIDPEQIRWDRRIYEAGTAELLAALAEAPESVGILLLVGHNPGLEALVGLLCGDTPESPDGKLLPTAALAQLDCAAPWNQLGVGVAKLVRLRRPKKSITDGLG